LELDIKNQQLTGDTKKKHQSHFCKSFVFITVDFQLLIRINNNPSTLLYPRNSKSEVRVRLSDKDIHSYLQDGQLVIFGPRKDKPFAPQTQVQACSIDLRLDNHFAKFKDEVKQFDVKDLKDVWTYLEVFEVSEHQPITLYPNTILFGQIYEQLRIPDDVSAKIVGRSRFARLGLSIHSTGDFINPEFEGAMPLQLVNHNPIPIVIYPFMTICQLILVKLTSKPLIPYPMRSSNPYHKEKLAGPSILHTDPAISGSNNETCLQEEIERRLLDTYLKDRERAKFMSELKKEQMSEEQKKLSLGSGGTIVINNSNIGVVNPGQLIGHIKSNIRIVANDKDGKDLGEALTQIMEFIESNSTHFDENQYRETLEVIDEITKQAALPELQRSSKPLLRASVKFLSETIRTVAAGSTLWQHWGSSILHYFGISQ
jgi:dCTP deaminase